MVVWATVQLSHQHLWNFKPFEIASTIGALAKLGLQCKVAMDMAAPLFQRAVDPVMAIVDRLRFGCLTMVAWAFAAAGHRDKRLFSRIAGCMLSLMKQGTDQCAPQQLVDAAWAFSSKGVRNEQLLFELSRRALSRVSDISRTLNSEDRLHAHIGDQVKHLARSPRLEPSAHEVARRLDGFTKHEIDVLPQVCAPGLCQDDSSVACSEVVALFSSPIMQLASSTASPAGRAQPRHLREALARALELFSDTPEPASPKFVDTTGSEDCMQSFCATSTAYSESNMLEACRCSGSSTDYNLSSHSSIDRLESRVPVLQHRSAAQNQISRDGAASSFANKTVMVPTIRYFVQRTFWEFASDGQGEEDDAASPPMLDFISKDSAEEVEAHRVRYRRSGMW
mmetsp:Transcript_132017/g.422435  ORF Transcript_132017/g.422435 Transcript_132017/m.422435 type:complete len:395 (+) Transcript_132017:437-1621(+)